MYVALIGYWVMLRGRWIDYAACRGKSTIPSKRAAYHCHRLAAVSVELPPKLLASVFSGLLCVLLLLLLLLEEWERPLSLNVLFLRLIHL